MPPHESSAPASEVTEDMGDQEEAIEGVGVAASKSQARFRKRIRRSRSSEASFGSDDSFRVVDQELVRAVSSAKLLSCDIWRLFRDNSGREETFLLSTPVTWMHYFISHSWRTPGWLKIVCIMYELNGRRAVVASFATHALVHGLEIAGLWVFPIPSTAPGYIWDGEEVRPIRWQLHYVVAVCVFFVVLRWGQIVPLNRKRCFLDKCCIHQTDAEKKMNGIKQLGAFLRHSEHLLILWQPEYFTRLWCIYELAAFSYVNKMSCNRVLIRPLKLTVVVISLCVFHLVASICLTVLTPLTLFSDWHVSWVVSAMPGRAQQFFYYLATLVVLMSCGLYLLPGFLLWKFCVWHMQDRRILLEQLAHFSLDNAQCHVAEDRAVVLDRISEWFGGPDEFEHYVRGSLYRQVEKLMQEQGPIPYSMVVVGSISHVFLTISMAVHAWEDEVPRVMWCVIATGAMVSFFTDAIAMKLVLQIADTSFGKDTEGETLFRRKLAGPLATASVFSLVNAVALVNLGPAMPLWCAGAIFAALLAQTLWSFNCAPSFVRGELQRRERAPSPRASSDASEQTSIEGACDIDWDLDWNVQYQNYNDDAPTPDSKTKNGASAEHANLCGQTPFAAAVVKDAASSEAPATFVV